MGKLGLNANQFPVVEGNFYFAHREAEVAVIFCSEGQNTSVNMDVY